MGNGTGQPAQRTIWFWDTVNRSCKYILLYSFIRHTFINAIIDIKLNQQFLEEANCVTTALDTTDVCSLNHNTELIQRVL